MKSLLQFLSEMNLNRLEAKNCINRFFVIIARICWEEYEIIKYNCDFVLIMKIINLNFFVAHWLFNNFRLTCSILVFCYLLILEKNLDDQLPLTHHITCHFCLISNWLNNTFCDNNWAEAGKKMKQLCLGFRIPLNIFYVNLKGISTSCWMLIAILKKV